MLPVCLKQPARPFEVSCPIGPAPGSPVPRRRAGNLLTRWHTATPNRCPGPPLWRKAETQWPNQGRFSYRTYPVLDLPQRGMDSRLFQGRLPAVSALCGNDGDRKCGLDHSTDADPASTFRLAAGSTVDPACNPGYSEQRPDVAVLPRR